jgi:pimeloyl-ACP methyl ester carboxylesterase
MNSRRHLALGVTVALVAVLAAASATPAYAGGSLALHCAAQQVAVALTEGGPADASIFGQLCYRGSAPGPAVQLTVHGATYNHLYWDFPYRNEYYSYVRAATLAGYATFNVDRIGAGQSSHPPGLQYGFAEGAHALHDVITKLRAGSAQTGGHAFRRIIWVGHSFGSIYGWAEIARYHDVDAAILTGMLHAVSLSNVDPAAFSYTADQDPLFAGIPGVDWSQYTTTPPGTRGPLFYYAPTAEPEVIAVDEQHKDTIGVREGNEGFGTVFLPPDLAPSRQITVPVLLIVGQKDTLFCAPDAVDCSSSTSVKQFESAYYAPEAHLSVAVIPETGHDLNLHLTAPATYTVAQAWALGHVAP